MDELKEKTTINSVAHRAGVSVATVSRVFNHKGIVSDDTLARVMQAAIALNYKPDAVRALSQTDARKQDHELLILNVPSLNNPFYSEIIKGAKSSAELHHCDVLINQSHIRENSVEEYIQMLKRVDARGVIVLNHLTKPVLDRLAAVIPVVQCGEYIEGADVPSVSVDDLAAAKRVMEYILSTGRRKIAFINGPAEYKYARHRRQGYYEALENAGVPIRPNWVIQLSDISADMAFSSVAKLLSQPNPPNAFF
ncbi:MAG: LacI family DNA-binding transcriptional regulator, partial [Oscillospiraceae bacterium]